ncbi:MAG TPA: MlaD family protein [Acidobacteriota bacterium]|nr:MlaD family protein [Acidobacteriota bacterium]
MSSEFRVGIFVVIGLVIVTYFLINIGEWPFFGEARNTYPLKAGFSNVVGLIKGADVVLSGVKIGEVFDIRLEGQEAVVDMLIFDYVDFPESSVARITSIGLLGQAIVEIIPGMEPGGRMARDTGRIGSLKPVTIDQLVSVIGDIGDDVTEVVSSVRDFLGVEGGKERIQQTLTNMLDFSEMLDEVVRENRLQVKRSVDSLELLSVSMRDKLPTILENMQTLSNDLKKLVDGRKDDVDQSIGKTRELIGKLDKAAETLQAILDKINKGEGAVGQLINNPEVVDKAEQVLERADSLITDVQDVFHRPSQISFGYGLRMQYYGRSEDFKSYYRLLLNISKRDSFVFELINDQIRNKPPVLQPNELSEKPVVNLGDQFTFTATYGRRFLGGQLRFGIIEGSTGAAFEIGKDTDFMQFIFEGYDFGRDDGPHLRLSTNFRIWQGLFLTLGYDDPIDEKRAQIFYGGGYRF